VGNRRKQNMVVGGGEARTCRIEQSITHRIWYNVIWNGNAWTIE
jgi:hypothetical protein